MFLSTDLFVDELLTEVLSQGLQLSIRALKMFQGLIPNIGNKKKEKEKVRVKEYVHLWFQLLSFSVYGVCI